MPSQIRSRKIRPLCHFKFKSASRDAHLNFNMARIFASENSAWGTFRVRRSTTAYPLGAYPLVSPGVDAPSCIVHAQLHIFRSNLRSRGRDVFNLRLIWHLISQLLRRGLVVKRGEVKHTKRGEFASSG